MAVRKASVFGFNERRVEDELRRKFGSRVGRAFVTLAETAFDRTPVYSGKTLRNWVASEDVPVFQDLPAVASPAATGQTSTMPLGAEPRRAANEAEARATLRSVSFKNPFKKYFFSNGSRVDDADPTYQAEFAGASRAEMVEYGSLPSTTSPRNQPQGTLQIAVDRARDDLRST